MEEVANLDCWATLTGAKAVAELARRVTAAAISFMVLQEKCEDDTGVEAIYHILADVCVIFVLFIYYNKYLSN